MIDDLEKRVASHEAQGKKVEAERLYKGAIRRYEQEDSLSTSFIFHHFGKHLERDGKWDKAEFMFRNAVKGFERTLGRNHLNTLNSLSRLGSVVYAQDKYNEAERIDREVLEKRRRIFGAEHLDTFISLNNISSVLWSQGKCDEAEKIDREVLKKREKVLGADHPDTLVSLSNIGSVLWYQEKYVEAEKMYRKVLERRRETLGQDHPDTLISLSNVGSVLWYQGKYVEAEKVTREVLGRRRRVLGPDHPKTMRSMTALDYCLSSLKMSAKLERTKEVQEAQAEVAKTERDAAKGSSMLLATSSMFPAGPGSSRSPQVSTILETKDAKYLVKTLPESHMWAPYRPAIRTEI